MAKAKVIKFPKKASIKVLKPDGHLMCERCQSRASITVTSGDYVKDGKKHRGTVIIKNACFVCYAKGIVSLMKT